MRRTRTRGNRARRRCRSLRRVRRRLAAAPNPRCAPARIRATRGPRARRHRRERGLPRARGPARGPLGPADHRPPRRGGRGPGLPAARAGPGLPGAGARAGGGRRSRAGDAAGELGAAGHVGGVFQIGFVAGDQHTVLGHHQIRLDKVRAQLDGLGIAFQRVVGQITRSATVGDDQRRLAIEGGKHWLVGRQRGQGQRGGAGQQKGFVHCVRLFECYVRQGWRANSLAQQDEGFLTASPTLGRRTTRLASVW